MVPRQYFQTDIRWANVDYSAPGETTTIRKAGCGPTCAAMVIASLANNKITPKNTAAWSLDHGYKALHSGTYYSYFEPQIRAYKISCKQLNSTNIYKSTGDTAVATRTKIKQALEKGNWIIACMGKGTWTSSGHYVLAYEIKNKKVLIHDPASTNKDRVKGNLETWLNEIKYAWEIVVPEVKEEEDDMTEAEVKSIIKKEQGYIANIADAPAGFQPILKELKKEGILNGTGTEEVGMSTEAVRNIIINYRMITALASK